MNWFKKIVGDNAQLSQEKPLVPRAPRVVLGPLHRLTFHPVSSERKLLLSNISSGGFGVLDHGGVYSPNEIIPGVLEIDKNAFELQAQVRHITPRFAGLEFVKPQRTLVEAIENFFRLEFVALRLRLVDPAYLQTDPRGRVVWLTDGQQNEVHAIVGKNGLIEFHLSFLGHHVQGTTDKGVRIGSISESEATTPGHKGATLIVENAFAAKDILRLALIFVSHASDVPEHVRKLIVERIKAAA